MLQSDDRTGAAPLIVACATLDEAFLALSRGPIKDAAREVLDVETTVRWAAMASGVSRVESKIGRRPIVVKTSAIVPHRGEGLYFEGFLVRKDDLLKLASKCPVHGVTVNKPGMAPTLARCPACTRDLDRGRAVAFRMVLTRVAGYADHYAFDRIEARA